MEKGNLKKIIEGLNFCYNEVKRYIKENYAKVKEIKKEEDKILNGGIIKNDIILSYQKVKIGIGNDYNKVKRDINEKIEMVIKLKDEIENGFYDSVYLNKNTKAQKFIIEISIHVQVIKSYIDMIENQIINYSNNNNSNIEMIYNMIQISQSSLTFQVK